MLKNDCNPLKTKNVLEKLSLAITLALGLAPIISFGFTPNIAFAGGDEDILGSNNTLSTATSTVSSTTSSSVFKTPSYSYDISGHDLNRIVLPFNDANISTTSNAEIQNEGQVLYILPRDMKVFTIFVSSDADPLTAIKLTFTPKEIPAQALNLPETKIHSRTKALGRNNERQGHNPSSLDSNSVDENKMEADRIEANEYTRKNVNALTGNSQEYYENLGLNAGDQFLCRGQVSTSMVIQNELSFIWGILLSSPNQGVYREPIWLEPEEPLTRNDSDKTSSHMSSYNSSNDSTFSTTKLKKELTSEFLKLPQIIELIKKEVQGELEVLARNSSRVSFDKSADSSFGVDSDNYADSNASTNAYASANTNSYESSLNFGDYAGKSRNGGNSKDASRTQKQKLNSTLLSLFGSELALGAYVDTKTLEGLKVNDLVINNNVISNKVNSNRVISDKASLNGNPKSNNASSSVSSSKTNDKTSLNGTIVTDNHLQNSLPNSLQNSYPNTFQNNAEKQLSGITCDLLNEKTNTRLRGSLEFLGTISPKSFWASSKVNSKANSKKLGRGSYANLPYDSRSSFISEKERFDADIYKGSLKTKTLGLNTLNIIVPQNLSYSLIYLENPYSEELTPKCKGPSLVSLSMINVRTLPPKTGRFLLMVTNRNSD